jgi:hypothetical protein
MSNTSLIFAVFSVIVGVLLLGIWSNIHAYAQQLPSSPPAAGSSSVSITTISAELKAKMCDPSNPSLKVVNTTESKICGIPKTVKPRLVSSSATPPPTSAVSSLPPQQTTKSTKPTTAAATVAALPKQQQHIATTTANNTVSRSTGGPTGATIAPVSNASNRSLSSSPIAPQVNAISQQQPPPQPVTGINITARQNYTAINSTSGQNYTFAATSPVVASDKLLYLGYHGGDDDTPTNDDSGSKHKDSSDIKTSTRHSIRSISDSDSTEKKTTTSSAIKLDITHSVNGDSSPKHKDSSDTKTSTRHSSSSSTTTDDGSTGKKKKTSSSTKTDRDHSTSGDSGSKHKDSSATKRSSHSDDGSKSSSSDLASSIRNKVDSIIKNSLRGVR